MKVSGEGVSCPQEFQSEERGEGVDTTKVSASPRGSAIFPEEIAEKKSEW